jgi:hypothetical protein
MKHLKSYKIFEFKTPVYKSYKIHDPNNIVETVRELLLYLEDENIDCRIWVKGHSHGACLDWSKVEDDPIKEIIIEINNEEHTDLIEDIIVRISESIRKFGWVISLSNSSRKYNEYVIKRGNFT